MKLTKSYFIFKKGEFLRKMFGKNVLRGKPNYFDKMNFSKKIFLEKK